MRSCSAVFESKQDAFLAAGDLAERLGAEHVNVLAPDTPDSEIAEIPITEDMPPVGGAMAGVLGSALGVGTAIALPGVGPIVTFGLAAVGLVVGGGLGWVAGEEADRKNFTGLPADEIYVYRDALARGRTVVVALVDSDEDERHAEMTFAELGAETIDAARENWWLGLRSAEKEAYHTEEDFDRDEPVFHVGFEAGCAADLRGVPFEDAEDRLRERFPDLYDEEAFRTGYERAQTYVRKFERWQDDTARHFSAGAPHP